MGSSESTGRSNGGEKEEERPTETNRSGGSPNLGAAAVAIGAAAVAAWGVSKMLSDNKSENNWSHVKDEMNGAFRSLGLEPPPPLPNFGGSTSSAPPRRFKLNTDGACHPNHGDAGGHYGNHPDDDDGVLRGPSGYAGILEDDCGNLVRGFRGFIGVSDCFTAELHGILKGLELLDKHGYKESILENDCQAAIEWVTGQDDDPGKSRKSRVVRDCWDLIKKSRQLVRKNNITVRICSRNVNKLADKLAKIAIEKGEAYVEFIDVHREINSPGQPSSFYC